MDNNESIFSQINSILENSGVKPLEEIDDHNNHEEEYLKSITDKFITLSQKAVILYCIIDAMHSDIKIMTEDRKLVYRDIVCVVDDKLKDFAGKCKKIGGVLKGVRVDKEEVNIFLYDYNNFVKNTFEFLDSYFYNGALKSKYPEMQ